MGLFTDTASEPFVWNARRRRKKRSRKRGKRADVLRQTETPCLSTSSPNHLLANVQSLDNKLCELRARISYQRETRNAALFASQKPGCLQWFQTQPSSLRLLVHRSDRTKKSSQGKAKVGAFVSTSTTRGVMKGINTLLNPSAPLIWNFICFCVDHSGYEGSQRS